MFMPACYFYEERDSAKWPRPINLPVLPATAVGKLMEGSTMFNLYKESSIDLGQGSDQSVVTIPIPRPGLTGAWLPSPKRAVRNERAACKDENTFANHFLATEGSIYFRDQKRSPRSFLWRVLDGHKVLEIRCADLTRSHHEDTNEAYLTLRLEFDEAILPACVALADPPDHDVLNVFALSSSKTLYTLTLRPDFFRRPKASGTAQDWCKTFQPPLFGSPFPHRLHAGTATEIFFSLDDGSLIRLRRKSGDDGSHWEPTTYSDGAWTNSIRGLVKWQGQNSVKYNGRNLDLSTATAIATASEGTYVYTVSLNHTLKAWNLANRKLNVTKDLLNKSRSPQDTSSLQLNPSESCFLRAFNAEHAFGAEMARENRHYLVTFSPHEGGQFKFWAVKGGLATPLLIEDLFPDEKFQPPDPDPVGNTIWNLADFDLKTSENGNSMELLVLWKNNTASQLNILAFDLPRLPQAWKSLWVGTAAETRDELGVVNASDVDPVDATESWLKYFFCPGRFSDAILETSLSIYQDALRTAPKSQHLKGDKPLKERMCSIIASTVSLWKHPDSVMDYERYRTDTDSQWRQFWRIAEDVNKRKQEALSVVYDSFSDVPWVIQTGGCCVIRECSDTELISSNNPKTVPDLEAVLHERLPNRGKLGKQAAQLSALIHIAATFRKHFPAELAQTCMIALHSELFQEPTLAPEPRLLSFYEAANFAEYVNDDAFDSLSNAIEAFGGYHQIVGRLFYQVLDTFPQNYEGGNGNLVSTSFGLRVMASGAEETITMNWKILFDLLVLLIFIEVEVHQAGEEMGNFNAPELFIGLVEHLREYEMMKWLATNSRQTTRNFSVRKKLLGSETESYTVQLVRSLLEDPWAKDVKPLSASIDAQSHISTHTARELVSLMTRSGEATYEEAVVFNQCELIRNGDLDLASDFLRFQPSNAWGTYIKGRLYLARNDFSVAATHFQKAAYLLSHGHPLGGDLTEMSSHLLDLTDANCFNNGLPKYYEHICSLFERAKAYTYTADFARLALDSISFTESEDKGVEAKSLRTDIISRLFNCSLLTSSYDTAYTSLSLHTDLALRKSALSTLITSMLTSPSGTTHLLRLPFASDPRNATFVDSILMSHAANATPLSLYPPKHSTLIPGPPYHQVLYSLRLARNDYRGAASVLFSRLQLLRKSPAAVNDPECKLIRNELLALINTLACVPEDEAYILAEIEDPPKKTSFAPPTNGATMTDAVGAIEKKRKRRIITLEDLRREYQSVLDRVSEIESGTFEFGAFGEDEDEEGDEMDFS